MVTGCIFREGIQPTFSNSIRIRCFSSRWASFGSRESVPPRRVAMNAKRVEINFTRAFTTRQRKKSARQCDASRLSRLAIGPRDPANRSSRREPRERPWWGYTRARTRTWSRTHVRVSRMRPWSTSIAPMYTVG